jgi:hypothetical protein
MTRNDVRKLIKSRDLSNSAEKVLLRVLDLTYRKDKDDPELIVEATSASFQRVARVKTRQLFNIMTQLESDKLLLDVETGNHIRCRLNLEAIRKLPTYKVADQKEENAGRATKAREKRAEIKELNRIITALKEAADKDRAEILVKMVLLQDVKDGDIKRAMMNWDVNRIRRAKANAEAVQRGEA